MRGADDDSLRREARGFEAEAVAQRNALAQERVGAIGVLLGRCCRQRDEVHGEKRWRSELAGHRESFGGKDPRPFGFARHGAVRRRRREHAGQEIGVAGGPGHLRPFL